MSAVQRADLGGVIPVQGPRRTVTRVHVGPAPGVCSVDDDGCGYCLGVPCRSPRQEEENETVATSDDDLEKAWDRRAKDEEALKRKLPPPQNDAERRAMQHVRDPGQEDDN